MPRPTKSFNGLSSKGDAPREARGAHGISMEAGRRSALSSLASLSSDRRPEGAWMFAIAKSRSEITGEAPAGRVTWLMWIVSLISVPVRSMVTLSGMLPAVT